MQTTKDRERVERRVEFKATDEDEQVATGIVMVPDKVDLQGDYVSEETISGFAEQFGDFEQVGEAGGGVMHAVWPSEHITLDENRVIDAETDIGGDTAPAGAWVQAWQFEDDELWSLISDSVLEGYSIGAVGASWAGPVEQDDLPDGVDVAEDYPDDDLVWELTDGVIQEVSSVDIPAAPDAQILETKADAEAAKRLAEHLGDRDAFIDEATQRGHSEEHAERLWDYLDRAVGIEGASDPGAPKGAFARAGKAFLDALTPGGSGGGGGDTSTTATDAGGAAKDGRTLSAANVASAKATHDAALDMLSRSDVEHGRQRFTDDPTDGFDVASYGGDSGDGSEDDETTASADTDTDTQDDSRSGESGRDAAADTDDTSMSDNEDDTTDDEKVAELEERIGDLEEKLSGEEEEKGGGDDVPEWAKELRERVDTLAGQAGKSQQLNGGGDDTDDGPSKADVLGLPKMGGD